MPKDKTKSYLTIILVLFTAVYIIHNLIAVKQGNQINCLETRMQASILRYYSIQSHPDSWWKEINNPFSPKPEDRGIYELISLPVYLVFGVSAQSAIYTNFIFLLLLVFSVYKIGSIVQDRYLGALAVFMLLMYPAIFGFTRIYFTPLASTAIVSFAIYCLLSSGHFKNTRKVILLTIAVIMLSRIKIEKGLVYLFFPAALYLIESFKVNRRDLSSVSRIYRNFCIFSILSIVFSTVSIGAFNFIHRVKYYLSEVCGVTGNLRVSPHVPLTDTAFIYLKDLYFIQIGELGFIFFILGVIFFLKGKFRHKAIISSWIIFPYLFHSAYYYYSGIHASYYTLEYIPAFALISSYGIYRLIRAVPVALGVIICASFITLNLVNYALINYYNKQLPLLRPTKPVSFIGKLYLCSPRATGEECFATAQALIEKIIAKKKKASVIFINHYPLLLTVKDKLSLYNVIKKNRVYIYDFSDLVFNLELPDSAETLSLRLKGADLIISGNRFYPALSSTILEKFRQFGSVYDFRHQVHIEEEEFSRIADNFELVREIKDPQIRVSFFINNKLSGLIKKDAEDGSLTIKLK